MSDFQDFWLETMCGVLPTDRTFKEYQQRQRAEEDDDAEPLGGAGVVGNQP